MGELLHIFDVRKASVTRTHNSETKREKINKFICINTKNFAWQETLVSKAEERWQMGKSI